MMKECCKRKSFGRKLKKSPRVLKIMRVQLVLAARVFFESQLAKKYCMKNFPGVNEEKYIAGGITSEPRRDASISLDCYRLLQLLICLVIDVHPLVNLDSASSKLV